MEIFQVNFDASMSTLIVKEKSEVYEYLMNEDDNFIYDKGKDKLYYRFSEDFEEECNISNVTSEKGIIQWESH